jgi:N12 class adenine-specific DNA methylase
MSYFNLNEWLKDIRTPKQICDALGIFPNIPDDGADYDCLKHDISWISILDITRYPKYVYESLKSLQVHNLVHNMNTSNLQFQVFIFQNNNYVLYNKAIIKVIDNNEVTITLEDSFKIKTCILNF